jgi:hypothetical protein
MSGISITLKLEIYYLISTQSELTLFLWKTISDIHFKHYQLI